MKGIFVLKNAKYLTMDEVLAMSEALTDPEFCQKCQIWFDGDQQEIVTDSRMAEHIFSQHITG